MIRQTLAMNNLLTTVSQGILCGWVLFRVER